MDLLFSVEKFVSHLICHTLKTFIDFSDDANV